MLSTKIYFIIVINTQRTWSTNPKTSICEQIYGVQMLYVMLLRTVPNNSFHLTVQMNNRQTLKSCTCKLSTRKDEHAGIG